MAVGRDDAYAPLLDELEAALALGARTATALDAQISEIARLSAEVEAGERSLAPLLVLSQRIRRLC